MALFDVNYMPIISLRPSEMLALKELPEGTKDEMLPVFLLRPWVGSHHLEKSLEAFDRAYPNRKIVLDLEVPSENVANERPVHQELRELGIVDGGYRNWCDFISQNQRFIPCLQMFDEDNIEGQLMALSALGRGLVVRMGRQDASRLPQILPKIAQYVSSEELCFLFDFGQWDIEPLVTAAAALAYVGQVQEYVSGAKVTLAASSFPKEFKGRVRKEILERTFFNECRAQVNEPILIYGDHASVAIDRAPGGAGAPPPRIDYPRRAFWHFFRKEAENREERPDAYQDAADRAVRSPVWDEQLAIWGTQMIKRTALGDPDAISSPMRSTAVRINIHLHIQATYSDPPERLYATDDVWTD